MTHYAITDGLLGLIALWGTALLLFRTGRAVNLRSPQSLMAFGLLTIALAALTGTLRFLTANHDLLKPPHLALSEMAGVVGSLWILFGLLGLRRSLPLPLAAQYGLPPLIFAAALFAGQNQWVILIAGLCLLAGQLDSLIGLFRQGHAAPGTWMLVSLLSIVAAFAGEAVFPDMPSYAWHHYHGLMAVWVLALVLSVKGHIESR